MSFLSAKSSLRGSYVNSYLQLSSNIKVSIYSEKDSKRFIKIESFPKKLLKVPSLTKCKIEKQTAAISQQKKDWHFNKKCILST